MKLSRGSCRRISLVTELDQLEDISLFADLTHDRKAVINSRIQEIRNQLGYYTPHRSKYLTQGYKVNLPVENQWDETDVVATLVEKGSKMAYRGAVLPSQRLKGAGDR